MWFKTSLNPSNFFRFSFWKFIDLRLVYWIFLCLCFRPCQSSRRSARCCHHPGGQGELFNTYRRSSSSRATLHLSIPININVIHIYYHWCVPCLILPSGPQSHLQYFGRPRTRGHLAEERQGDHVRWPLHPQVCVGQVRHLHHHRREHVRLWQVQHPCEEQVRHRERGLHRKCLHRRGGGRQEKIKAVQILSLICTNEKHTKKRVWGCIKV